MYVCIHTYIHTYIYIHTHLYEHTYIVYIHPSISVCMCDGCVCVSGPTPLHLAARCGSLETVSCLLANYANILATDQDGWAPIHYAAYFDHVPVIRMLVKKNEALLELQTKNEYEHSPATFYCYLQLYYAEHMGNCTSEQIPELSVTLLSSLLLCAGKFWVSI